MVKVIAQPIVLPCVLTGSDVSKTPQRLWQGGPSTENAQGPKEQYLLYGVSKITTRRRSHRHLPSAPRWELGAFSHFKAAVNMYFRKTSDQRTKHHVTASRAFATLPFLREQRRPLQHLRINVNTRKAAWKVRAWESDQKSKRSDSIKLLHKRAFPRVVFPTSELSQESAPPRALQTPHAAHRENPPGMSREGMEDVFFAATADIL